jgi:hypothetical protein
MSSLTNAETLDVWAKQSRPAARSAAGSLIVQGRLLLSYGPHFVAALCLPQISWLHTAVPVALTNADRYSATTSRHTTDAVRRFTANHPASRIIAVPDLTPLAHRLAGILSENLPPENLLRGIAREISAHFERLESERPSQHKELEVARAALAAALITENRL